MSFLDRHIGIEIENESLSTSYDQCASFLHASTSSGYWLAERDGSLRGGELSWEIKTRGTAGQPARLVRTAMNEVAPLLQNNSGIWRAAVHTHVDVRDVSSPVLGKLLAVLYCYDSTLFTRFSPHRVESNFCVPLFNITPHVIATVRALVAGCSMGSLAWNKYSSCNFAAVRQFGTVEFRHMQTPRAADSLLHGQSAASSIWEFAATAVRLVDAVVTRPRLQLPALLERVGGILGESASLERSYTMLTALRGDANDSITDADLGSLYSAALGRDVNLEHERTVPAPTPRRVTISRAFGRVSVLEEHIDWMLRLSTIQQVTGER